ncbi:allophanate hydrolase [Rhodococcoides fascians]|uniref:5-oxoprolinase subunit B family protein n=1 Tax=Rhodococcoides fascians TaxID=1828 RepID=UPI000B9A8656|nr:carboxyltransferase domain-containing protein [Rhodococcus fascians]OZE85350.1 allophanate hydrolase [Rhodococcus fascians]OZF11857.1 allophanate hydrolase [Rhodococcus fascians]OZF14626.1 allophanate hydrolase [Rhodococcus fascians]OZF61203.1 allophanate hydrolase [Rhodococcus fascians]OZF64307.1 allophanate hydrolase [Rhodococcus fascians]
MTTALPERARYSWGGDEYLFVEIDEAMSLEGYFVVGALADALRSASIDGVSDICPTNNSLLLRYDPDVVAPRVLRARVQELEAEVHAERSRTSTSRVFEVPVWYEDPYTSEVGARFRANHQTPDKNDLEFAAEVNNLAGAQHFIQRHHETPWMVTAVGFVAALPFMYQMTTRDKQLEVPKYLSPRTDTPALTVGHGGCFTVIYSVRGAGGYQMFGIAAAPVFAPDSALPDFQDSPVLFRAGDIVKFSPIDQKRYEAIQSEIDEGTFRYRTAEIEFDLARWTADPDAYNADVLEALHGDTH